MSEDDPEEHLLGWTPSDGCFEGVHGWDGEGPGRATGGEQGFRFAGDSNGETLKGDEIENA